MRRTILSLSLCLFAAVAVLTKTTTSISAGNWTSVGTWDNWSSKKLAKRNGMNLIRSANGKELPENIFGITKAEWTRLKSE